MSYNIIWKLITLKMINGLKHRINYNIAFALIY